MLLHLSDTSLFTSLITLLNLLSSTLFNRSLYTFLILSVVPWSLQIPSMTFEVTLLVPFSLFQTLEAYIPVTLKPYRKNSRLGHVP